MKKEQQKKSKTTTEKVKKDSGNQIKKEFQIALEKMKKYKNVKGYIILVDNSDDLDEKEKEKTGNGMQAIAGSLLTITNLFTSLSPELIKDIGMVLQKKTVMSMVEDLSGELNKLKKVL